MFKQQVKRAKANYTNNRWKNERSSGGSSFRRSGANSVQRTINHKSFSDFANKAYKAKRGYAIRRNPTTGEKEMFVRGTTFKRGGIEWFQNFAETPVVEKFGMGEQLVGDVSRHIRGQYSKFLSKVAVDNQVDVVYGHSRGGAIVNDMLVGKIRKVSLDGATILNRTPRVTNYRQKQAFDAVIGLNSRATVKDKKWTPFGSKRYHKVYN